MIGGFVRNSGTKTISRVLNVNFLPELSNFCVPPIMRPIPLVASLTPSSERKREAGKRRNRLFLENDPAIRKQDVDLRTSKLSNPGTSQTLRAAEKVRQNIFSSKQSLFAHITTRLISQHPRHAMRLYRLFFSFPKFESAGTRDRADGSEGEEGGGRRTRKYTASSSTCPRGSWLRRRSRRSIALRRPSGCVRNTHSPRAPPDPAPVKTQAWRQRARLRLRTKPLAAWHPPPCMGLRRAWQRKQHRTQRRGPRMVTPLWRRPARARRSVPEATCASESESAGHHQLWPAPCAQWLQSRSP